MGDGPLPGPPHGRLCGQGPALRGRAGGLAPSAAPGMLLNMDSTAAGLHMERGQLRVT